MSTTGANGFEGRTARMERTTSESSVLVEINLDGTGVSDVSTSVPFYDHMLTALSKHSLIDMTVKATGDTHIDVHHTVEDVAITFGEVLRTALGNKAGIRRFGEATVPLDELEDPPRVVGKTRSRFLRGMCQQKGVLRLVLDMQATVKDGAANAA